MSIGDIKNVTSQVISHYEKNSGPSGAEASARKAGASQAADRSAGVAASPNVTIDFSAKSQDFVQIKNTIAQLPEVREEVVQALKTQIETGSYKIDSAKLAGKMVQESLLDIFA